jgi:2-dehydro-3-deoxygluconokinase
MSEAKSTPKAVFFGELMMRLATHRYERIVQAREMEVDYTGAEANVGVSLANYGLQSYIVSAVPDNEVGQACMMYLRQFGLNLDYVKRAGYRLGIYFVETGAAQRPSLTLYNRKGSAITELRKGDIDWDEVMAGKDWFHFTGITPALADSVAELTQEACLAAKRGGLTVSCDLNFRSKLWPLAKAQRVMTELMQSVDVLFTNEEEASKVFGISARDTDIGAGKLNMEGYDDVARQLLERFGLRYAVITLRESYSATVNDWSGMFYDGTSYYHSRKYHIDHIVDRVGGGDAFSGGFMYGILTGMSPQDTVEFATAASCLKHTIHGDFNLVTLNEIQALMQGGGSGRIQR